MPKMLNHDMQAACRRMKLKRNYHFMQYDDHAKGTPVSSPTHADRGRPDRLLSGEHTK